MFFKSIPLMVMGVLSAASAQAGTLGTPLFTTAAADINIVNYFGPGGRVFDVGFAPFDSYVVSVSTTIASSAGLPGLVGQSLEFTYGVENGSYAGGTYGLEIGGFDVFSDPLNHRDEFLLFPPLASDDDLGGGLYRFTYDGFFADFGPRIADFPEFVMGFEINQPLPTMTGYESCNIDNECDFSRMPLVEILGKPVVDSVSYDFVEGTIAGGTITFFTPGGPLAPVPLPASGLVLMAGLGGLSLARRRRGR